MIQECLLNFHRHTHKKQNNQNKNTYVYLLSSREHYWSGSHKLDNRRLGKPLRMPMGCGEQTMIFLAPNVYVMQYLLRTRQVTADIESKAYRMIQSGE